MSKTIDELLEMPYWVIDILPQQVPADSPGQYFAVERHFLEPGRLARIKRRHIDVVLKLNCYRRISIDDGITHNPAPEQLAAHMRKSHTNILVDEALIVSEPDATHLTLYNPDEALLSLVKQLATSEALFTWQPPN